MSILFSLKDLSHYEYDDMVRKSMHLLNRYFSAHHSLFNRAVQAQVLITDSSVNVYTDLEKKLPVLRRLAANKLGDAEAAQLADILEEMIGYVTAKLVLDLFLPVLIKYISLHVLCILFLIYPCHKHD